MAHLLKAFHITAHTGTCRVEYSAIATSSADAALDAADLFGDVPCSVTVKPLQVFR
jgi:hypothetical protein